MKKPPGVDRRSAAHLLTRDEARATEHHQAAGTPVTH